MNNLITKIKSVLEIVVGFLLSPRLKAFYWSAANIVFVQFISIVTEQLTEISAPGWIVVIIGLISAQVTKAINNKIDGKRMGFVR